MDGGRHSSDISPDIESISDKDKTDKKYENIFGVSFFDDGGNPLAIDGTDTTTSFLDGGHKGQHIQSSPEHAVAKLSPGLRISSNARWIIIGGTSDDTGSYLLLEAFNLVVEEGTH